MESAASVVSLIRKVTDTRAIDVEMELISYDRKKTGIISPVSLQRWISSIGLHLSGEQIQSIVNEYKLDGGVDWRKFSSAIGCSKPFSHQLMERLPACIAELHDFAEDISSKHLVLKDVLRQFDPRNRGIVPTDAFLKAFGASQVNKLIVRYYADTITGHLDYFRLQNDLDHLDQPTINPDCPLANPPESFETLVRYIKSRSIDVVKEFARVDSLNSGKVSSSVFSSLISGFGAALPPSSLQEITAAFTDEQGFCSYKKLANTIQFFHPAMTQNVLSHHTLPQAEIDPLTVIEAIKKGVELRRIDIAQHFDSVEQQFKGAPITRILFTQLIQSLRLSLSNQEIEAICKHFESEDKKVDYKAFISSVSIQRSSKVASSSDVVSRLKEYITSKNLSLVKQLSRFDREESGDISIQQLSSAIQFLGFPISNPELFSLRDAYPGSKYGLIHWRKLCDECSFEREEKEPVKEESKVRGRPSQSVLLILRRLAPNMSIYVTSLKEADTRKNGFINQDTFSSILRVPPSDGRVLSNFYRISGSSSVNYEDFLCDLEASHEFKDAEQTKTLAEMATKRENIPLIPGGVHSLIKRFKAFCNVYKITPESVFLSFDCNRTGLIPVFKVGAAFSKISFTVLRDELESLINVFRDLRRNGAFNYRQMLEATEEESVSEEDKCTITGNPISTETMREAMTTVGQIREKALARNRNVRDKFTGISGPTVSFGEFQKRISQLGIVLSVEQIQSLWRKYRVGLTEDVNWENFCKDVDESKTIGSH